MRRAIALLSCFFLFLSLSPCPDDDFRSTDVATSITQDIEDNSEEEHEDDCSPFCSCACCKLPIIQKTVALNTSDIYGLSHNAKSQSRYLSFPNYKIWQPPRI